MSTARAIRRFTELPVDDDVLLRCIEAASWRTPADDEQPWRFVIMKSPESRRALAAGADRAVQAIEPQYLVERPHADDMSTRARTTRAIFELHDNAANVPAAVLFCVKGTQSPQSVLPEEFVYPALQNFLLTARATGLGAVVTGWDVQAESTFRETIGIPDEWSLAALVVVGWPPGRRRPAQWRPLTDVTAVDRWDQPAKTLVSGTRASR